MPNFKLTHLPLASNIVNSEEGKRVHPTKGYEHIHTGIDFVANINTSVYATHAGRIIKTSEIGSSGKTIALYDDTTGLITLYEHLESYLVGVGAVITQAQVNNGFEIGKSGDGNGLFLPHLHVEMIDGNIVLEDGRKVFEAIEGSGDSNLGINPPNKKPYAVQRINPRPYLADLAISIAKTQLASENPTQYANLPFTVDENLTTAEKQLVYDRSCTIFDCSVKAATFGIELAGDKRDNTFSGNDRDNIMIGDAGLDTYGFTDFSGIGRDVIKDVDKDGKLLIDQAEVSGVTANCILDVNGSVTNDAWLMNHNGKQYYLARINDVNKKDVNGKHLMIVALPASDDKNNIKIDNFDFVNGGFGIFLDKGTSRVNNYNMRGTLHRESMVIKLSNGNFLTRWLGDVTKVTEISSRYIFQIFNKDGSLLGNQINEDRLLQFVTALSSGGFVGLRRYGGDVNGVRTIYQSIIQKYDDNGQKIGNPYLLINEDPERDFRDEIYFIESLSNNRFVVSSKEHNTNDVYAEIFNDDGSAVGRFKVNSTPNPYLVSSLTKLANNRFLTTWTNIRSESFNNFYDTHYQICTNDGVKIGAEGVLLYDVKSLNIDINITPLSNGGFIISRATSFVSVNFNNYLYSPDGTLITSSLELGPNSFYVQFVPLENEFVGIFNGQSRRGIYAKRFNNDGVVIGNQFQITPNNSTTYYISNADRLLNGDIAASYYTAYDSQLMGRAVRGRVFFKDGTWVSDEFVIGDTLGISFYDITNYMPEIDAIGDNNFVAHIVTKSASGYPILNAQVFNSQGVLLKRCKLSSQVQVPKITEISQKVAMNSGVMVVGSAENSNLFILPDTNTNKYQVAQFDTNKDQLDFSVLSGFYDESARRRLLQTSTPVVLKKYQNGNNTRIDVDGFGIEVTLLDIDAGKLNSTHIVGDNLDLMTQFRVSNLNQTLSFNQTDASIALEDIAINPLNKEDEFRVKIEVLDSLTGAVIANTKDLALQVGISEAGVESTFKNGVWEAQGNSTQVNDLLMGLKVEIGEDFQDRNFALNTTVSDLTRQRTKASQFNAVYNCVALPPQLIELIESQETQVGKKLVMDLIRYFANPNDPELNEAVFSLTQNLDEAQNQGLNIARLNQTAFEVESQNIGLFNLTASISSQCEYVAKQLFQLRVEQNNEAGTLSASPFITNSNSISASHSTISASPSINHSKSVSASPKVFSTSPTAASYPNSVSSSPFAISASPSYSVSGVQDAINIGDGGMVVAGNSTSTDRAVISGGALAGILTGSGVILLTVGVCLLYKNSKAVRNFCSKLIGGDKNKVNPTQDQEEMELVARPSASPDATMVEVISILPNNIGRD